MNSPTVSKASKRNLRKKFSRYAKKAKLTIEEEITSTLNIGDNKDNESKEYGKDNLPYEEKKEIFYNLNKVS
jgi:hypothetical protein